MFNEIGDNPNASTAMIQILGQKPVVVWPKDAAEQKLVLPAAEAVTRARLIRRRGRTASVRRDRARSLSRPTPMDPTLIAQSLVSGVLFGGVYSLMAVGLTLIFGVMRVVNFAHGDMMVWGMYLAWLLATRLGIDPTLGFAVCAAALFVLGVARPAGPRGPDPGRAPRDADPAAPRRGPGARERGAGGVRPGSPARAARR